MEDSNEFYDRVWANNMDRRKVLSVSGLSPGFLMVYADLGNDQGHLDPSSNGIFTRPVLGMALTVDGNGYREVVPVMPGEEGLEISDCDDDWGQELGITERIGFSASEWAKAAEEARARYRRSVEKSVPKP